MEATPAERIRWTGNDLMERHRADEAEGDWLFELWLECLAHAARHPEFRSLAAGFWSGTRAGVAAQIEEAYRERGQEPPAEGKALAIALTALDIGIAVQRLVDPDDVPLELYPELYELLFVPLTPE